jgi:hypothetical protein
MFPHTLTGGLLKYSGRSRCRTPQNHENFYFLAFALLDNPDIFNPGHRVLPVFIFFS